MLSLLKKGPSANKVPAEKIQATYGRYRMQALLSVFLGYLAYYIVRNNFTLSTPYLKVDKMGWHGGFYLLMGGIVCCILFCYLSHRGALELEQQRKITEQEEARLALADAQ